MSNYRLMDFHRVGQRVTPWKLAEELSALLSKSDVRPEQVKAFLHEQEQLLEQQRDEIEQRIDALKRGDRFVAAVLTEKCAGWGLCADVCPASAIDVNEHAVINWDMCTCCGKCVSECPNEAIILISIINQ